MEYSNYGSMLHTEFGKFKLHVLNMCPFLVKSHPEYSEELKNLLESQIIEYRIENTINDISGCVEIKSYIIFNDNIKELIIRASKDIHDVIMADNFILQCVESGFNINNYSFFHKQSITARKERDYNFQWQRCVLNKPIEI